MALNPNFSNHEGCDVLNITYVCFVYDLMLFYYTEESSLVLFQEAFDLYAKWSGLKANDKKSHIFFSGVSFHDKKLTNVFGFPIGTLSICL